MTGMEAATANAVEAICISAVLIVLIVCIAVVIVKRGWPERRPQLDEIWDGQWNWPAGGYHQVDDSPPPKAGSSPPSPPPTSSVDEIMDPNGPVTGRGV